MIDFIDGQIVFVYPDAVVVKAGEIGYRIYCPRAEAFGREGDELRIFTHQHVREDAITLYGFKSKEERELFRRLLGVTGVGPKSALSILAAGEAFQVVQAIYNEDIQFLTQFPGVGKKTAQRLIFELKDKLELDVWLNELITTGELPSGEQMSPPATSGVLGEAIDALIQLGYNENEANRAVMLAKDELRVTEISVDELIKKALQSFVT